MKILFCTNTFENIQNGPSKFARALLGINEMAFDSEIEIRILTEDISVKSQLLMDQKVFKTDLRLNSFTRPWGFLYRMFPYYLAIKRARSSYPFDIVVFNNAITGIWSALFLKTPVIGMINDYTSMTTGFHNFRWDQEWFRRMLFRIFERIAVHTQKAIIVNSKYMLQKTQHIYGSNGNIHLLYKGISTENSIPPQIQLIQSPVKVLFVKADFLLGGLLILAQALEKLEKYDFELFVVGPAYRFRSKIENHIRAPNIKVKFMGPLGEESVYDLMKTCNLFIVPSYREALGVANMEALLNGITVISSDQGGIPEVLNYGKNGWMTPPGDPDKLSSVINHVISNPELRATKSANGYDFTHQHFDLKKSLCEFVRIISSLS